MLGGELSPRTKEQRSGASRCFSLKGSTAAVGEGSRMPHVENDRIVESTTEARAGVTGQNVNYVLLISTVAVIVLFAVAYFVTSGWNG
jgi:hypothetical protein